MLLSGVLFVLFLDGCWLYCLADAALTPASEYRGLSKMAWLCVIIATFIVGAIAWVIVRRKSRTKSWAAAQVSRTTLTSPADPGVTWYANGAAADAAVARHPACRSSRPRPTAGPLPRARTTTPSSCACSTAAFAAPLPTLASDARPGSRHRRGVVRPRPSRVRSTARLAWPPACSAG